MSGERCELCGHKAGTAVEDSSQALFVMAPALFAAVRWALLLFKSGHLVAEGENAKRLHGFFEEMVSMVENRRKS
jgi:hypothetical protein